MAITQALVLNFQLNSGSGSDIWILIWIWGAKTTCREWKGSDGIKKFEKHWFRCSRLSLLTLMNSFLAGTYYLYRFLWIRVNVDCMRLWDSNFLRTGSLQYSLTTGFLIITVSRGKSRQQTVLGIKEIATVSCETVQTVRIPSLIACNGLFESCKCYGAFWKNYNLFVFVEIAS